MTANKAATLYIVVAFALAAGGCAQENSMNALGERYVRLVLAVGQHDTDYVDAYYGPPEWRNEAEVEKLPLGEITARATALERDIAATAPPASADELVRLRHMYLRRQLVSLQARVAMKSGTRLRFDEESQALYDAVAPTHSGAEFESILAKLDARLQGSGSLVERYDEFRRDFIVPRDRLDATFTAAIEGCRSGTLRHITLPAGETFTVEYVTGKSWSG